MDVRQFLSQQGFKWVEKQRPKGLEALMECPVCHDKEKSFAVSLSDGAFNCLRLNNCGVKGSFYELQKMLGIAKPVRLDSNNYILNQPIKYIRPKVHSEKPDKAIEYLASRGLSLKTIEKFKIGYKDGAIMFPYYKNKELVGIKYRSIAEKKFWKEKDCEPTLFNQDNCTGEGLVICEGEIDCMSLAEYDIPAVSVPQGASDMTWIENGWEYLNRFQKIYLFMDGDTAGQNAVVEIVKRLGAWRCFDVALPYKDANECLMKGVDVKVIAEAVQNAKEFDPPTLLKAVDFTEDIVFMFEHPEKLYGIATPWAGLDEILKGWRDYELTIWSGRSSSGKSTMLNEVIWDLLRKGHKAIIASLEMPPHRYLRWMLMRIKQKASLNRQEVTEAIKRLNNLYVLNITGEILPNDLIDVFDFAARKYGVKHFFIDSLMKISLNPTDELKEQKLFVNALIDKLSKTYAGHVHLVAHPRKGMKDSDKPDKVDISGSGDITNLADNVIMVHRISREEKERQKSAFDVADTTLYVKKNREHGIEDYVNFKFIANTKTFEELVNL